MKQAVVILHGMGEQVPMETLNSFVDAVWTTDESLVDRGKPDPDTGNARSRNAAWAHPDARNGSFELRRIRTEGDRHGNTTEFFEYYWAHLMHGTTLQHVQSWIVDLLWRNPWKRVPRNVLHAWLVLWAIALVVLWAVLGNLTPALAGPWAGALSAIGGGVLAWFTSNVLIKRFGDVARYVKALPPNVARRQEIRANGVALLERLIQSGDYDRIVVVAHSLGTIVAYDILSMLFAQMNSDMTDGTPSKMLQPERAALEEMIRDAAGLPLSDGQVGSGAPLDIDAYQVQQAKALAETQAQGLKWIITDFITLGSPLTHAEFLMADSEADLHARQTSRLLPTCPPMLEYDGTTKLHHLSYDPKGRRDRQPEHRRVPHHGAPFALTRWTNLYSQERYLLTGDLISGPLAETFAARVDGKAVAGIKDIAVLPALDADGTPAMGHKRRCVTHNNYWKADKGTEKDPTATPHHIAALRAALQILRRKEEG